MRQTDVPINLGRCLLAGLLTGIINAVVIVFFDVYYRKATGFYAFDAVMPITIFMAFPLFDLASGGVYFLFADHLQKGNRLFRIVFILLTLIIAAILAFTGRFESSTGQYESSGLGGARGLLFGMELICGLLTAILIPWLAQHPKLYLTSSDIKGEE